MDEANALKPLLVKAQLTSSPSRKADGSVKLTFTSMEEISNEDFSDMDKYWKQGGWLAFKTNDIDINDLPKENATVEGQQTPSQYQRSILFALHMAKGGRKEDFPAYYDKMMRMIANQLQSLFPEEK